MSGTIFLYRFRDEYTGSHYYIRAMSAEQAIALVEASLKGPHWLLSKHRMPASRLIADVGPPIVDYPLGRNENRPS